MVQNICSIFFVFIVFSGIATGQSQPSEIHLSLVKNSIYKDTIVSSSEPVIHVTFSGGENGNIQQTSLGNNSYEIIITPPQNFIGSGMGVVETSASINPPAITRRWTAYHVNYHQSIVNAAKDYVIVPLNSPDTIQVFPLINDFSTTGSVHLESIGNVIHGDAEIQDSVILYVTNAERKNDFISYGVKDSEGAIAQGIVSVVYLQDTSIINDTLIYIISNSSKQTLTGPFEGFEADYTALNHGQLNSITPGIWEYIPDNLSSGTDSIWLTHSNGSEILCILRVFENVPGAPSVRNDIVYTPRNASVQFNVFQNDLSWDYPIDAFSTQLNYNGNGIFTYNPPQNFTGTKEFYYRVNYGSHNATAKISVYVGNMQPRQDVTYAFDTDKYTPLAFQYDMPINGYTFEELISPEYGILEIYHVGDSAEVECDTLSSKAILIYTPYPNVYNVTDEFQVRYCINGGQCRIYKLYVTIHDATNDSCGCIGKDCIWQGDLNGDGRVSVTDVIALGRYISLSGPDRQDSVLTYRKGLKAENWGISQPNGQDIKHADADGDGILHHSDLQGIYDNYGKISNLIPTEILAVKEYPFRLIPNQTSLDSGDLLVLEISVGNSLVAAKQVQGLSFKLNINPAIIDSSSFEGEFYNESWLGDQNPLLQLMLQPRAGEVHAGVSRSGINPASGQGVIGKVVYIVVDEVDGFKTGEERPEYLETTIVASEIQMETPDGEVFMIPDAYQNIRINKKQIVPEPREDKLLVMPNPASEYVRLHFNGKNTIEEYKLYDLCGQLLISTPSWKQQSAEINTARLPAGIYVLKVTTTVGIITKKIEILR